MKVRGHETWVARVPYEENRAANHIVLRVRTDEGEHGVSYLTPLVSWTIKPICAAIDALMEKVVGQDVVAAESINATLLTRAARPQFDGLARSAASVIDLALWDLKAKAFSQPLYRLLGASGNSVPTYASWKLWPHYDLDSLARHAAEHVASGFRGMKFHAGRARSADVIARARLLREAVGNDIDLHLDMNFSRTVKEAIAIGEKLAPFNLSWIEGPIREHDHEGLRQISEVLETPICAGETFHEARQFRSLLDHRGVDVVMVDLEVGGITQWLKIAHIVEAYGLPVANHMCTEIAGHAIAGIGGLTVEYIPWAQALFKEVPAVENGKLILSDRPGLGLELDLAALKKFAS
jgi:L-alanine-DL-glutamate epimerase-like enolase superfamily enzyme